MNLLNEIKLLFRKPWKIILTTLIATVFIFTILVLLTQFILDGKIISFIKDNYSKVATVVPLIAEDKKIKLEYSEIDPEVIDTLKNSKYINDFEIRQTVSGKVDDYLSMNSYFMFQQTNSIIVFNGVVENILDTTNMGNVKLLKSMVKVKDVFAGKESWIQENDVVFVVILDKTGISKRINVSKEYTFLAMSSFNERSGTLNNSLYCFNLDDETIEKNELFSKNKELFKNGIVDISESEDAFKKINLENLKEEIKGLDYVFSIRLVKDMNLLIPVVNEIMFLESGRFINEDDSQNRVCLVSLPFANKHGLKVGETINISLSDKSYNIDGYESGYPSYLEKSDAIYGQSEAHEIIGIYTFSTFDSAAAPLLYGYNDIFIPKRSDIKNVGKATPYSMSFKVSVDDIDNFETELVPTINSLGYSVISSENKWSEVESNFNSISNKRIKTIIYMTIILIIGSLILNSVVTLLFKVDYIIRRIFSGSDKHINNSYKVPLILSMIIGNILVLPALILVYKKIIINHIDFLPTSKMPSILTIVIAATLAMLVIDLISLFIMKLYTNKQRKKNIIELM